MQDAGWHLSWFGARPEIVIRKVRDAARPLGALFRNVEAVGMTEARLLELVQRMIERGATLWGEALVWVDQRGYWWLGGVS